MVGKRFRKTAVNDIALSQSDEFTAKSIRGDVESHPAIDGRKLHTITIGIYLGVMVDEGYIKAWTEEGRKSKTYRVNGHRISAQPLSGDALPNIAE